jgi:preprotein translocase subunit YajC
MTLASGADLALAGLTPPGGSGSGAVITQLLFFAAIFAIFYFLLIRPQQRQKAERQRMLEGLKRGDRVVTASGLHGTITALTEHTVTLRVADQVKLDFDRAAVGRVMAPPAGDRDA